jgi:hypothetical protein
LIRPIPAPGFTEVSTIAHSDHRTLLMTSD